VKAKMHKKWIGSLVLCAIIWAIIAHPVLAFLNEGIFIPACRTESVPTDSRMRLYQVKRGDTLWGISRAYNVELETVMLINNLNINSILTVGQTLQIPYERPRIHVIRKGETMWDVAIRYDISVSDLKRANPDKNPKRLRIGDKLNIPDSTYRTVIGENPSRGVLMSSSRFIWPLVGIITSYYGWRNSGFHHGLDIAGDVGDSIRAAESGKVIFAGFKPVYGYTVIIEHADGKQTVYAHASSICVKNNQKVVKGQVIAAVGASGNATGPHLHFEIREGGKTQNPLGYLK